MKIAVVRATCGHTTCVGPDDYKKDDYSEQMDAAIGWHIEAGYMPAQCLWVEVLLPDIPPIPLEIGTAIETPVPDYVKEGLEL